MLGMMIGVELSIEGAPVVEACLEREAAGQLHAQHRAAAVAGHEPDREPSRTTAATFWPKLKITGSRRDRPDLSHVADCDAELATIRLGYDAMRHLLTLADLKARNRTIFAITEDLKAKYAEGLREPLLPGRVMALLFEKPSLRTRVSFEAGMIHLGGSSLFLGDDVGLGARESHGRFRPRAQRIRRRDRRAGRAHHKTARPGQVQQLLGHQRTDRRRPSLPGPGRSVHAARTVRPLTGQTLAYIGDGNNVARCLAEGCGKVGMRFNMATPEGYHFDDGVSEPV